MAPKRPAASSLLDLLEEASKFGQLLFEESRAGFTFSQVWDLAEDTRRWLLNRAHERVAMILSPSGPCITALFGAWRAGMTVASIPAPSRGISLKGFREQTQAILTSFGAQLLLVDESILPQLGETDVPVDSFQAALKGGVKNSSSQSSPGFVQFSSGTTDKPKGVILDLDLILTNAADIAERLDLTARDVFVSWLPWSHDMGLIGMVITAYLASFRREKSTDGVTLFYMTPEQFLRDPQRWMRACSDLRATITAAPNFALARVAPKLHKSNNLDLSSLRSLICGAEPILASTVHHFYEQAQPYGLSSQALCPAYGLAEATLAVAMLGPQENLRNIELDTCALDDQRCVATSRSSRSTTIMSCGRPLQNVEVRIDKTDHLGGTIQLRGPSIFKKYLGGANRGSDWFKTGDIGILRNGDLYVVGRSDDTLIMRGRKLRTSRVEAAAVHPSARLGTTSALAQPDGSLVIVCEPNESIGITNLRSACIDIRRAVMAEVGVSPAYVIFTDRGTIPKTSSGKIQRHLLTKWLTNDALSEIIRL